MRPASARIKAASTPKVNAPLGLVAHYTLGKTGRLGALDDGIRAAGVIARIEEGLRFHELDTLRETLGLPMQDLASKLGISKATLQRRKVRGRLGPEESDRLLRFAKLVGIAVEVMGTPEHARRWLCCAQVGLGGAIPLEYAKTEVGAREVEDLLGRIEFGVYS